MPYVFLKHKYKDFYDKLCYQDPEKIVVLNSGSFQTQQIFLELKEIKKYLEEESGDEFIYDKTKEVIILLLCFQFILCNERQIKEAHEILAATLDSSEKKPNTDWSQYYYFENDCSVKGIIRTSFDAYFYIYTRDKNYLPISAEEDFKRLLLIVSSFLQAWKIIKDAGRLSESVNGFDSTYGNGTCLEVRIDVFLKLSEIIVQQYPDIDDIFVKHNQILANTGISCQSYNDYVDLCNRCLGKRFTRNKVTITFTMEFFDKYMEDIFGFYKPKSDFKWTETIQLKNLNCEEPLINTQDTTYDGKYNPDNTQTVINEILDGIVNLYSSIKVSSFDEFWDYASFKYKKFGKDITPYFKLAREKLSTQYPGDFGYALGGGGPSERMPYASPRLIAKYKTHRRVSSVKNVPSVRYTSRKRVASVKHKSHIVGTTSLPSLTSSIALISSMSYMSSAQQSSYFLPFYLPFVSREDLSEKLEDAQVQAEKTLNSARHLVYKARIDVVSMTYSATDRQTKEILRGISKRCLWRIEINGRGQATVASEIVVLLNTRYKDLRDRFLFHPVTTAFYQKRDLTKDQRMQVITNDIKRIQDYLGTSDGRRRVLFAWQNQFTIRRAHAPYAIGGGLTKLACEINDFIQRSLIALEKQYPALPVAGPAEAELSASERVTASAPAAGIECLPDEQLSKAVLAKSADLIGAQTGIIRRYAENLRSRRQNESAQEKSVALIELVNQGETIESYMRNTPVFQIDWQNLFVEIQNTCNLVEESMEMLSRYRKTPPNAPLRACTAFFCVGGEGTENVELLRRVTSARLANGLQELLDSCERKLGSLHLQMGYSL